MKHSKRFSELFKSALPAVAAAALFIALFMAGCGRRDRADNLFQIPWPDENGKYSLQVVSITGFDQRATLQGRYVQVFVNPYARDGQIVSQMPIGRFVHSKDGVYIPADYTSLQATAIHAHFERFYQMDRELGVELEWPVKVGIRSNVRDRRGMVRNNAIFDGRLDALLIVPYLPKKGLPIGVNAGILAHEHFHMIFQDAVIRRIRFKRKERLDLGGRACAWGASHRKHDSKVFDSEEDPSLYPSLFNEFSVRGLNEGLADVWGWVYTGDVDFIGHSLPLESPNRRLDEKVKGTLSRDWVKEKVFNGITQKPYNDAILSENVYVVGSTYARLLYEIATETLVDRGRSFESRKKIAQAVINALPAMAKAAARAESTDSYVSPDVFLKALYDNWPRKDEAVCKLFKRVGELNCEGEEE